MSHQLSISCWKNRKRFPLVLFSLKKAPNPLFFLSQRRNSKKKRKKTFKENSKQQRKPSHHNLCFWNCHREEKQKRRERERELCFKKRKRKIWKCLNLELYFWKWIIFFWKLFFFGFSLSSLSSLSLLSLSLSPLFSFSSPLSLSLPLPFELYKSWMEATAVRGRVAENENELSYRQGDLLTILDSSQTTWWVAERLNFFILSWKTIFIQIIYQFLSIKIIIIFYYSYFMILDSFSISPLSFFSLSFLPLPLSLFLSLSPLPLPLSLFLSPPSSPLFLSPPSSLPLPLSPFLSPLFYIHRKGARRRWSRRGDGISEGSWYSNPFLFHC